MLTMFLASTSATRMAPDDFRGLVREFAHALEVYEANADREEFSRVLVEDREPATISRFMDLVDDQRAADPEIVDALVWVSKITATWGSVEPSMSTLGDRARMLLVRHHILRERIGLAMGGMMYICVGSKAAEVLFREGLAKNPHRDVRGRACFWLAMYLKRQAEFIPFLRQPEGSTLQTQYEKQWGKDAIEKLKEADPEKLLTEADGLFALTIEQFADVSAFGQKNGDELLGGEARVQLHELRNLAVGKVAPDIIGEDADGKRLRLADYRGNVVLLTFSGNWCGFCRAMYPQEREMMDRLRGKHFTILSVNTDRERESLRKSLDDGTITWPCWWDVPKRRICKEWNVTSFPTIYVIDGAGVIRYKGLRGHTLDEAVNTLVLGTERR
jgi:peroxiredoxin